MGSTPELSAVHREQVDFPWLVRRADIASRRAPGACEVHSDAGPAVEATLALHLRIRSASSERQVVAACSATGRSTGMPSSIAAAAIFASARAPLRFGFCTNTCSHGGRTDPPPGGEKSAPRGFAKRCLTNPRNRQTTPSPLRRAAAARPRPASVDRQSHVRVPGGRSAPDAPPVEVVLAELLEGLAALIERHGQPAVEAAAAVLEDAGETISSEIFILRSDHDRPSAGAKGSMPRRPNPPRPRGSAPWPRESGSPRTPSASSSARRSAQGPRPRPPP